MSIQIELDPRSEAALNEHAAAAHLNASQYVSRWVEILASNPSLGAVFGELHEQGKREALYSRAVQIEALRRKVEEFGRKHDLPSLPDEAVTREAIYQDHD